MLLYLSYGVKRFWSRIAGSCPFVDIDNRHLDFFFSSLDYKMQGAHLNLNFRQTENNF